MFDDCEALLPSLTHQSTRGVEVEPTVIERLKTLFGERQLAETVATVAAYNMVSRLLVSFTI